MSSQPGLGMIRPLSLRIADRIGVHPLWLGFAAMGVLMTLFLGSEWAFDRLALIGTHEETDQLTQDLRVGLVLCALLAFLPVAQVSVLRGSQQTLDELRPGLHCSEAEFTSLRQAIIQFRRRSYIGAGCIGAFSGLAAVPVADFDLAGAFLFLDQPEPVVHRIQIGIIGFMFGGWIHCILATGRQFSELAHQSLKLDLLDLRPTAPFARQGLRTALAGMGLLSLFALLFTDYDAAPRMLEVLVVGLGAGLLLVLISIVLPVRGLRERIRREKTAELDSLTEMIRQARDSLSSSSDLPSKVSSRMADLVAYRQIIEGVHEWPFNVPVMSRVLLYLAIPIGSWVAGALVERLVDLMLT